jgi:hypothetical protein
MTGGGRFTVYPVPKSWVPWQQIQEAPHERSDAIPRVGADGGRVPRELETVIMRTLGRGRTLERPTREEMGTRLRHDFRGVRVHTGLEADKLTRQLSAKAFTIGEDIFFGRGLYDPTSPGGRELIAHELVHVVQQRSGRVAGEGWGLTIARSYDAFELEAEREARRASEGVPAARSRNAASHDRQATRGVYKRNFSTIIQRAAADFVTAANTATPTPNQPHQGRDGYYPRNCNEGVMGWLIKSRANDWGSTHYPWQLVKLIRDRLLLPVHWGGIEVIGRWLYQNIYTHCAPRRVTPGGPVIATLQAGDILYTDAGGNRSEHSMAVVGVNPAKVIRAVNNFGTFGGSVNHPPEPYPPQNNHAYDPFDRNIERGMLWHRPGVPPASPPAPAGACRGAGNPVAERACINTTALPLHEPNARFGSIHHQTAELYVVTYAQAIARLNHCLQHWTYRRTMFGPGWAHRGAGGGVVCGGAACVCPH